MPCHVATLCLSLWTHLWLIIHPFCIHCESSQVVSMNRPLARPVDTIHVQEHALAVSECEETATEDRDLLPSRGKCFGRT